MSSLTAVASSTRKSGTAVVKRPVGDTPGICYREEVRRSVRGGVQVDERGEEHLQEDDEEEEEVGIATKLVVQEQWKEGEKVVFGSTARVCVGGVEGMCGVWGVDGMCVRGGKR